MIRGSCLCGKIKYEIRGHPYFINHCHCSICRKAHGAAFGSFLQASLDLFDWTSGEELVTRYESSPGNKRCFCSECGANMPVIRSWENHVVIPAGTLDDDPGVRPVVHIFTGSQAPWYEIRDDLPQFQEFPPDDFWERGVGE